VRRPFRTILLSIGVAAPVLLSAQTHDEFRQDFDTAWRAASARYAYFDAKATSWADVPKLYADDLQRVSTRDGLVALLEHVLNELYDTHAQLNVNLANSPRLVPSGTDLWAEWRRGEATITDVRADSDAQRAGIRPSDVVESIDNTPIADAVDARLGRSYSHSVPAARDWALRAVLAGRHGFRPHVQQRQGNQIRTIDQSAREQFGVRNAEPVSHSRVAARIGYVRFNDSLGDDATIQAFDRALDDLGDTRALILDLRNTPSGGNSVVAKGILGRFVTRDLPYQRVYRRSATRAFGVAGSSLFRREVPLPTGGPWRCSWDIGQAAWVRALRSGSMRPVRERSWARRWQVSWVPPTISCFHSLESD
jgi:carboxyl-terminal processing protease